MQNSRNIRRFIETIKIIKNILEILKGLGKKFLHVSTHRFKYSMKLS